MKTYYELIYLGHLDNAFILCNNKIVIELMKTYSELKYLRHLESEFIT